MTTLTTLLDKQKSNALITNNKRNLVVLALLILNFNSISCLRVENLKEINKDSSSITIEWTVNGIGNANNNNNNNESPSLLESSLSGIDTDWIGFKIKYFTDKLQFTPILLKNSNLRKFRLDNLKSNTEYKIQVSAYNKLEFEGPASSLLTVRTHEAGL